MSLTFYSSAVTASAGGAALPAPPPLPAAPRPLSDVSRVRSPAEEPPAEGEEEEQNGAPGAGEAGAGDGDAPQPSAPPPAAEPPKPRRQPPGGYSTPLW